MPRFESINFNQNIPKIKLFLQKMQKFLCVGARPPDPHAYGGWELSPQAPKTSLHCEYLDTRLVFLLLLCYFV